MFVNRKGNSGSKQIDALSYLSPMSTSSLSSSTLELELPFSPAALVEEFQAFSMNLSENEYNENTRDERLQGAPRKEKRGLSDRFIPSRKTSKFTLLSNDGHRILTEESGKKGRKGEASDDDRGLEGNNQGSGTKKENNQNDHLLQLFKRQILGIKNDFSQPTTQNTYKNNFTMPMDEGILNANFENRNLLRYKDDEENINKGPVTSTNRMLLKNYSTMFNDDLGSVFSSKNKNRKIPKTPFKILDAPSLQDDFYLNLIDWSSQNVLAVALANSVYLWSAANNRVSKLCDLPNEAVTAVNWGPKGSYLAIGTQGGDIQIWDSQKSKQILVYNDQHESRVGSLAWSSQVLCSGSRDKTILFRDIREGPECTLRRLNSHKQEVCGLKWSFDEQQLASGGNDNKLYVWNLHSNNPVRKYSDHTAAVKAIAWSPHQHGLLASGGGTADRTIRFWNTLSNSPSNWIDTESQVCNLIFSKNVNEIVSTHGYSMNEIMLWKYPSMEKIGVLSGHTSRVLYLAMSPDGETIVTGAGDETLRFWNIFPKKNGSKNDVGDFKSLLVGDAKELR